MRAALLLAMAMMACSNPASDETDMARPDLRAASCCGNPGDKGNALGVGKYCQRQDDCAANSKARICTQGANPTAYFCTFACPLDDRLPCDCGEGAQRECNAMGCACTPTICVTNPPPGCMR